MDGRRFRTACPGPVSRRDGRRRTACRAHRRSGSARHRTIRRDAPPDERRPCGWRRARCRAGSPSPSTTGPPGPIHEPASDAVARWPPPPARRRGCRSCPVPETSPPERPSSCRCRHTHRRSHESSTEADRSLPVAGEMTPRKGSFPDNEAGSVRIRPTRGSLERATPATPGDKTHSISRARNSAVAPRAGARGPRAPSAHGRRGTQCARPARHPPRVSGSRCSADRGGPRAQRGGAAWTWPALPAGGSVRG